MLHHHCNRAVRTRQNVLTFSYFRNLPEKGRLFFPVEKINFPSRQKTSTLLGKFSSPIIMVFGAFLLVKDYYFTSFR